ncbi:MAG: peptidase M48 [Flammeovirgaceae bacterium]|nr:peptidase M48 [Flammeovirgaceae bacterium]|tara:strand:+ start:64 stop:1305 length:1242 start_codon:yes stop_codon:yes gene_type:complete
MDYSEIKFLLLAIVTLNFLFELISGLLNFNSFDKPLPKNVRDIYSKDEYSKSQSYKKVNFKFELISLTYGFLIIFLVLYFGLLGQLDSYLRNITFENEISLSILFFLSIYLISDLIKIPFQLYKTFIIEENFGFNTMKISIFLIDKIKSYLISSLIIVILITPLLLFIILYPDSFWIYFWILISAFLIFANIFYTSLIVPLFNKLEVLQDGELKQKLDTFSRNVNFPLSNIFVINGSLRSKKANAFFSGIGKNKKIVLYDTLIKNHSVDELVAVLAHEIGHYKLNHVKTNMVISVITTGFMLFILSNFIFNSQVSYALGGNVSFRHLEIFAFFIIYSPISSLISILMNIKSRKNEYEADEYAVKNFKKKPMIDALKRLSKDNLTNLTPHPLYEFINYSHPSISKRLYSIEKIN